MPPPSSVACWDPAADHRYDGGERIGTCLPGIMVSTAASLHGQTDLAVGTALGSNITNILLILGLAALTQAIYRAF